MGRGRRKRNSRSRSLEQANAVFQKELQKAITNRLHCHPNAKRIDVKIACSLSWFQKLTKKWKPYNPRHHRPSFTLYLECCSLGSFTDYTLARTLPNGKTVRVVDNTLRAMYSPSKMVLRLSFAYCLVESPVPKEWQYVCRPLRTATASEHDRDTNPLWWYSTDDPVVPDALVVLLNWTPSDNKFVMSH